MQEQPSVKLCECGCGNPAPIAKQTVTARGWVKGEPVRFIRGHRARLGHRPMGAEGRAKLSAKAKAQMSDPAVRERMSAERKGIPRSPETIEKVRKALTGRTLSPEQCERLSQLRKGRPVTLAMSAAYARRTGELHPDWKGTEATSAWKHQWLSRHFTKTGVCSGCGRNVGTAKNTGTEWAFLHHPEPHTRNRSDYAEMCKRCHRRMDEQARIERIVAERLAERLQCQSD